MEKTQDTKNSNLLPNVLFFLLYHKPKERKKVTWILAFLLVFNVLLLSQTLFVLTLTFLILAPRWYVFHLICHYVLDDKVLLIRGINIAFIKDVFKRSFKWFMYGGVIPYLILFPPILIYLLIHDSTDIEWRGAVIAFFFSLFLAIYQCILFTFVEKYTMSTIVSEGLKANMDLQNFSFNSLYGDFRDIIIKKIMN